MNQVFQRLKGDAAVWIIIFLLSLISLLAVYSSTGALAFRFQSGNTEYYFIKHFALILMGLGTMYLVHRLDYRIFSKLSTFLMAISLLFLVYIFFQGEEYEINSANRWVNVWGQSFQPSDLAKFSLMVYLAKILTRFQGDVHNFYKVFLPVIGIILVVCGLIAPSNLSTAALIFTTGVTLMYVAGARAIHIVGLILVGVIGLGVLFKTSSRAETWQSRTSDYAKRLFDPGYRPNYQTVQANIAIVSGGITGKGAGKSVQRNFLPHPYSDFIYAIIIEEYGLIGGIFVLFLYLLLLFRALRIAKGAPLYGKLLANGLSFIVVIQALVNMGVTVGLLPVTGLPLPLISMGGTSIIFTCASLGIIVSVSRVNEATRLKTENETD